MIFKQFSILAAALALGLAGIHAQETDTETTLAVTDTTATPESPSSSFDSVTDTDTSDIGEFTSTDVTVTDTSDIGEITSTDITVTDSSEVGESTGTDATLTETTETGESTSTDIIGDVTESTYPPTFTSCFITATGSYPQTTEALDPQASDLPDGAECFLIVHESDGAVQENLLYTVDSDGATISYDTLGVAHTLSATSSATASSSSDESSSSDTGSIVGAVIGAVFGTLLVGVTLLCIRRYRRAARARGTWYNRPAGWVEYEKPGSHYEMSRRASP